MAKRRTIPGTNIPIGRKKGGGGLTQKQRKQAQRDIDKAIGKPAPKPGRKPTRQRLYGTGDAFDYVPFNIDNKPRSPKLKKIFDDNGIGNWRELFVHYNDIVGKEGYRQSIYNTPWELIKRFNSSILPYVKIAYNPNTDTYHAFVDY